MAFIKVDLRSLQSIKIVYEKRSILLRAGGRRVYMRSMLGDSVTEKEYINKRVKGLTMLSPDAIHVFEDLEKEGLVSREKAPRERRKRNARTPWKLIPEKIL